MSNRPGRLGQRRVRTGEGKGVLLTPGVLWVLGYLFLLSPSSFSFSINSTLSPPTSFSRRVLLLSFFSHLLLEVAASCLPGTPSRAEGVLVAPSQLLLTYWLPTSELASFTTALGFPEFTGDCAFASSGPLGLPSGDKLKDSGLQQPEAQARPSLALPSTSPVFNMPPSELVFLLLGVIAVISLKSWSIRDIFFEVFIGEMVPWEGQL